MNGFTTGSTQDTMTQTAGTLHSPHAGARRTRTRKTHTLPQRAARVAPRDRSRSPEGSPSPGRSWEMWRSKVVTELPLVVGLFVLYMLAVLF